MLADPLTKPMTTEFLRKTVEESRYQIVEVATALGIMREERNAKAEPPAPDYTTEEEVSSRASRRHWSPTAVASRVQGVFRKKTSAS